jgi:hypothetical protein
MRILNTQSLAVAVALSLTGLACGSSSTPGSATQPTVSGLASASSPISTVGLKDSSTPATSRTTTPDASGNFTFDVAGLTPPFFLKADAASGAVYAIASKGGTANVNPITTAACAGSSEREGAEDGEDGWSGKDSHSSERIGEVIQDLGKVLKPLFDLYGVQGIGEGDEGRQDSHLRALLEDVSFVVKHGVVTVTNRASGAIIFTAPLRHLSSGTFSPENMPAGPGGTPGTCAYTYDTWGACQADGTQTRTVASATPAGCTGTPILSQTCTYTAPTPGVCSYTYSAWTSCQADGTQTRTVLTSGPTGCTGSPVLSQSCTYVPPPPPTPTPTPTCTLATAVPSCSTCHGAIGSGAHASRPTTCASCHGPVNNGSGTPSAGMTAALSGTACRLSYPTSGTHKNGTINFGAAQ